METSCYISKEKNGQLPHEAYSLQQSLGGSNLKHKYQMVA